MTMYGNYTGHLQTADWVTE